MHFIKLGDYFAASMITGPKHNLLKIRLAASATELLQVHCLPPQGQCKHEPLDEKAIVAAIQEGVAEANKELGANYAVSEIAYVQNDTKPEVVYGFMALSILRHLHSNGAFIEPPPNMQALAQ